MRVAAGLLILALAVTAGCGGGARAPDEFESARRTFPPAPTAAEGALRPSVQTALAMLLEPAAAGVLDRGVLSDVARSQDARLAWVVSDLLRFFQGNAVEDDALVAAFDELTGVDPREDPAFDFGSWRTVTDYLLAWDVPAPPGYRELKAALYLGLEPGWSPFFEDADSAIDWRLVAWGGVLIDARELGDPAPCLRGCIPALDDPHLVPASAGSWYPDDRSVFGVVVGSESVAFPKNVMEVHELVNVTIGGRRLGIPYCTLCGSAQAYLLDAVPGREPLVLRTSGLLSRSNKLMYDLTTRSAIDTFTGRALSGPLQDAEVTLPQVTVVTSTWGAWKAAHPRTTIVAADGGIGREYPYDPLRGRDDGGPIFPIGDVDGRLPVQAKVLGVVAPTGTPVAFPVEGAREALATGRTVAHEGVELVADGSGLRARAGSQELPAHEAFWFAWSQFHAGTEVWSPTG